MDSLSNPIIPSVLAAIVSLLGAYLLILRIRDALSEKPDPKLTYSTLAQFEQLNQKLTTYETNYQKSINQLRLEIKNDYQIHDRSIHRSTENINSIVRKNIQDIAALQAQFNLSHARITELTLKSDKLLTLINKN